MITRRGLPAARADVPNLAPMVDVVMVILIFFMLGTSFGMLEGVLPTQLPSQIGPGGGAAVTVVPVVHVALLEGSGGEPFHIRVMEQPLPDNSFEALRAFMEDKRRRGADATGPVVIGAEPDVAYQHVISAMDACVRAGFGNIQFSIRTDAPSTHPPQAEAAVTHEN